MVKKIDAATRYAAIDKKVANARLKANKGKLYLKNNLSKKPAKAVDSVRNFINNQFSFNISMKQNYSKNVVELDLLDRSYGVYSGHHEKNGYQVLQRREIPVTATVATYTKAAREMTEAQLQNKKTPRPSNTVKIFDKIKSILGL